jgi:uncharacterized protein YciI
MANAPPMQFLAITRRRIETFSDAQFEAVLGVEAAAAKANYARGEFRDIRSRGDVPGALITIEAPDAEAAWALVEALPLARAGMMDVEMIPVLPYRGFV